MAVKPCLLKIAPDIGVPASIPRPIVAQAMPIRVPITALLGEIETPRAGMMETMEPEKKPYRQDTAINEDWVFAGMKQKARAPVVRTQGMTTLKRPILAATRLGPTLPKMEPAVMMGRR